MLTLDDSPAAAGETLTIFTPLGIRFWDAALDRPVQDGLTVTARLPGSRHEPVSAFLTGAGVYAFQGLPGLHALEYPGPAAPGASLPVTTRFLIDVEDRLGRFLPMTFSVDLPYYGIYPTSGLFSLPPGLNPPGFYLFSAPARPGTLSLSVVRGQLEERVGTSGRRPAGYAVVEVDGVGPEPAYGLADARGSVAVFFPHPTFSGPDGGGSPLSFPPGGSQQWDVTVRVRYAPGSLVFPGGSARPELRSMFDQTPALIWSTLVTGFGQPAGQLATKLVFGQELVLRTDSDSTLLISPAASPL